MLFMRHYWLETYAGCIFSVDKNCSAKAAALCTEEKARLSIFVFYRRRRKRKSWKKNMFSFSEIGPYRFFSLGGHHESVGDLHPRFTRLTADTSKTFAVTSCRGSPSRKPSRFVASQLHLLRLCISVPFLSILHLSGRGENAGILGMRRCEVCEATQLRGRDCFEIILNEKTKKLMAILKLLR